MRLADEIGGLSIKTDVTDRADAVAAVERTARQLGRLDIVIHNAGVMLLGPIVDAPIQEWDRMVAVNLRGLLHIARSASTPAGRRRARATPRRRSRERQLRRGSP